MSKLTIEMRVNDGGIEADIIVDSDKETYFFKFGEPEGEAGRIDLFLGSLPRKFYLDSFLRYLKR